jgi:hypothetical protein
MKKKNISIRTKVKRTVALTILIAIMIVIIGYQQVSFKMVEVDYIETIDSLEYQVTRWKGMYDAKLKKDVETKHGWK